MGKLMIDDYDEDKLKDLSFEFTFEMFWEEVEAYAEQNRLSTSYVEEEFIIDGVLHVVQLDWCQDADDVVHYD